MASKPPENLMPTPFELWVQSEGLKVITKHTVYDLETEPLSRGSAPAATRRCWT